MVLGRITEPFRMRFQQELGNLNQYRQALMGPARRDAVGSLMTASSSELGAMSYTRIPYTLDIMLLTATVGNRKEIEDLNRQIEPLRSRTKQLQDKLEEAGYADV